MSQPEAMEGCEPTLTTKEEDKNNASRRTWLQRERAIALFIAPFFPVCNIALRCAVYYDDGENA